MDITAFIISIILIIPLTILAFLYVSAVVCFILNNKKTAKNQNADSLHHVTNSTINEKDLTTIFPDKKTDTKK